MLKEYKIKQGIDIYDVSNTVFGGLNNVYQLVLSNDIDMNTDLDTLVGGSLTYDTKYYSYSIPQIGLNTDPSKSTIEYYQGLEGQNLFDVCLMTYGDLNDYYRMISENSAIDSTNDQDVSFKRIKFDTALVNKLAFKTEVKKKGYVFTSFTGEDVSGDYRITSDGYTRLTSNLNIRLIS